MTLILFNNNKQPDTRMAEYDQAIVRLGLEKANLEKLVDSERKELAEVGSLKAEVERGIKTKKKELAVIENDIAEAVTRGHKTTKSIGDKIQDSDLKSKKKKTELAGLEKYLKGCEETIAEKTDTIKLLEGKINELRSVILAGKEELLETNKTMVQMQEVISKLSLQEKELRQNVSVMEDFAKALQDKEQFLNRKEYDLGQYEKRVEKSRQETGNNNKMIFK